MKLELGFIQINDIQFAKECKVENGTLFVDADAVRAFLYEDDDVKQWVKSFDFDIAKPGESVRITPVKDVIEPRVKVEGPGGQFPGGMEMPENMELPEGMEFPGFRGGMEQFRPAEGMPEGMEFPEGMQMPEGMERPEGMEFPEGMQFPNRGEGKGENARKDSKTAPEGAPGGMPRPGGFGGGNRDWQGGMTAELSTVFTIVDGANYFSAVAPAQ